MIYKTIDEWIEHNPNHIGALPIEVCHQIWGTKGKETSMTEDDDDIQDYKKPWIDLTDDEMLMIYGQNHEGKKYNLGRMVQQALKEKNT